MLRVCVFYIMYALSYDHSYFSLHLRNILVNKRQLYSWESCIGCRSPRELTTSCICWSTSRPLVGCQHTLLTCSRLQGTFCHWLHCTPPRTATTLFRVPTVDLATRIFQSLLLEFVIGCRATWGPHRARPKSSNFKHRLKTFLFNCVYCDWQHIVFPYCYAPSVYL